MGKKINKKAIAVGIVAMLLIMVFAGMVSAQNDCINKEASLELKSSDDIFKDLVAPQLNVGMGMGVSPALFKKELSPDEVENENLTIFNAGDDVLNFEIQIEYVEQQTDWLSVFPKNGTITPCNKTKINVTFNTTGLVKGEYHANITVIGNDILKLPVRVHLTVRGYRSAQANVTIKSETLNLKSKGLFTAFITLPELYNITDINISTVVCEGAPAVKGMVADDKYIAKFNRQDLVGVPTGNAVTLTVTGELTNGTPFEGGDTIRVIDKS